jgi:hypothetical protein
VVTTDGIIVENGLLIDMPSVRVECDRCGEWVTANVAGDETVACDCGSIYAVTVTKIRDPERVAP